MRTLVVATATTPAHVEDEIRAAGHHRLDYMELSTRLGTEYIDYNRVRNGKSLRWVEEKLRMDIRQAMQAAHAVRQRRYEAVISLSERVGIPLGYMLGRHIKHAVIMHHPLSPSKIRLMRMLKLHRRWDMVIAISRAEAEALQKALGLEPDHVAVLNTPVDTKFYRPPEEAASEGEQDRIQSIGLSYRDYPTLIRAMRMLPHIPCHIRIGSSWVHNDASFENEALPDNVHIEPFVHPCVLRKCYAKGRFAVVPIRQSTQWSAGCTSVQQAQAMGKAVIATRMPGLSDYVLDGETGMLVEGSNPKALAEAIDYLWQNPEKASAMGRRGREWVDANFSLEQWVDDFAHLLGKLN